MQKNIFFGGTMKKIRFICALAFLMLAVSFGGGSSATEVQAASLTNVMKAPKAKAGSWVIAKKGYRYRYKATKKYAKNAWLKIGGHIYYFKSNSYLQTGWKTYNKKKYYFDKTGCLVTGWKKIGQYYYYFYKSNGSMAVNKKVGKYYVDAKGRRKKTVSTTTITTTAAQTSGKTQTAAATPTKTQTTTKTGKVDIFVGDSRTVGMGQATGTSSKCIAKVGEGYVWFVNTALPQLKAKLKKNPKATVVINLGVNDVASYPSYISKYQELIKSYPKAHIYIMSVNPVDSKYTWGWLSYSSMTSWIKKFNAAVKKALPNNYIDCYTYLTKNKFSTVDGVHYTTATYKKIYNYILTQV